MRTTFFILQIMFIITIGVIYPNAPHESPIEITEINEEPNIIRPVIRPKTVEDVYCLAEAVYWESRNQPIAGMQAVGNVIYNRKISPKFPNTLCGVVHQGPMDGSPIRRNKCQFSYYCDGKSDIPAQNGNITEQRSWENAMQIAHKIVYTDHHDNTYGSTYYHAAYVTPNWAAQFVKRAKVGAHLFYKP